MHLAPGAIDVPQLFVCANGAAATMLEMLKVPVWLFVSMTLDAALVVPMPWLAKVISLGVTDMFWACRQAHEINAGKRKPQRLLGLEITGNPLETCSI